MCRFAVFCCKFAPKGNYKTGNPAFIYKFYFDISCFYRFLINEKNISFNEYHRFQQCRCTAGISSF